MVNIHAKIHNFEELNCSQCLFTFHPSLVDFVTDISNTD